MCVNAVITNLVLTEVKTWKKFKNFKYVSQFYLYKNRLTNLRLRKTIAIT